MIDLIVRGGSLVTSGGVILADLAVEAGRIRAIGSELSGTGAAREIDARGLTVFPGVIDVHVHFNEPGRTGWEGAATGSRAFAAGGGTLFFDMPLNSNPCTLGAREFDDKQAALERAAITDFALWGGIVPGNLSQLAELAERGVVGFKAFLCDSGLPEFPRADDLTLFEGMREAARWNLPVAIHAESQELTTSLAARLLREGRRGVRDYLESRPVLAELEAIQRALLFAAETGVKLHIVHVSSGRGVAAIAEARAGGLDVSAETCPHYLFFTEDDLLRLGAAAKCAPPLRSPEVREALWTELLRGHVDMVASDHSPALAEMKLGDNFFQIWGGIAGIQSTLAVLLEEGYGHRGLELRHIAQLTAAEPARRFGIPFKGGIAEGNDADLVLVDLSARTVLQREDLLQRHPMSPYIGASFRGVVRRTMLRGETIFLNGEIVSKSCGKMIRTSHAPSRTHA